jgi:type IV pilus assembly protein PilB
MNPMGERLGEILLRDGVVEAEKLQAALLRQREKGGTLGDNLVATGAIESIDDIVYQLASQINCQVVPNLMEYDIAPEVLGLVPDDMAIKHGVLPVQREGQTIHIVTADPRNLGLIDTIKFITGCQVRLWMTPESQLKKALDRYYVNKVNHGEIQNILQDVEDANLEVVADNKDDDAGDYQATEAPLVRLVNKVLSDAVKMKASDIHIESFEKTIRVRYRIDGNLIEQATLPYKLRGAIVSRVKIMANLDIAERRLPQDGRIKLSMGLKKIDLRVSTLPTIFGEKVVMRILDSDNLNLDLTKMGFNDRALKDFQDALGSPYGMILVTGPTGSGKSTTLYSAMSALNNPDTNIMTAEDPVEYNLEGINQVNVNNDVGLTFAAALKSFLRQDPDVIMVGEVRDLETAQIAIKAALTGHLVLSTLHTNDAPSTITRLVDMGIEPFLVASSVRLVIAQRLMRKVCQACRQPVSPPSPEILKSLGINANEAGSFTWYEAKGCQTCNNMGYKGRTAIHQVLPVSDAVKRLIVDRATPDEIEKQSIQDGINTLRMSAILRLKAGLTTFDEVIKTTAE